MPIKQEDMIEMIAAAKAFRKAFNVIGPMAEALAVDIFEQGLGGTDLYSQAFSIAQACKDYLAQYSQYAGHVDFWDKHYQVHSARNIRRAEAKREGLPTHKQFSRGGQKPISQRPEREPSPRLKSITEQIANIEAQRRVYESQGQELPADLRLTPEDLSGSLELPPDEGIQGDDLSGLTPLDPGLNPDTSPDLKPKPGNP